MAILAAIFFCVADTKNRDEGAADGAPRRPTSAERSEVRGDEPGRDGEHQRQRAPEAQSAEGGSALIGAKAGG